MQMSLLGGSQGATCGEDKLYSYCAELSCGRQFEARKGKRFCSNCCRAKYSNKIKLRKFQDIVGDSLSELTIRTLARHVPVKKKPAKPFKMNAAHRQILKEIDRNQTLFIPATQRLINKEGKQIITDPGRRCRELRAAGYLKSERAGRFIGYQRV